MYGRQDEVSKVSRASWGLGILNNSVDLRKKAPPWVLGIWGPWPWVSAYCNTGMLESDKASSLGGGLAIESFQPCLQNWVKMALVKYIIMATNSLTTFPLCKMSRMASVFLIEL